MPRTPPEWIAKHDDQAIPARVLLRIFGDGICAGCSCTLYAGRWHADHIRPLWDGGEHREANLQPLCEGCHGIKTGAEATQRAEARRHRAKAAGIKKAKRKMPYRRFDGTAVWPGKEK